MSDRLPTEVSGLIKIASEMVTGGNGMPSQFSADHPPKAGREYWVEQIEKAHEKTRWWAVRVKNESDKLIAVLATQSLALDEANEALAKETDLSNSLYKGQAELQKSLDEARKEIERLKGSSCSRCEGSGELWADGLAHYPTHTGDTRSCPDCGGSGKIVAALTHKGGERELLEGVVTSEFLIFYQDTNDLHASTPIAETWGRFLASRQEGGKG